MTCRHPTVGQNNKAMTRLPSLQAALVCLGDDGEASGEATSLSIGDIVEADHTQGLHSTRILADSV